MVFFYPPLPCGPKIDSPESAETRIGFEYPIGLLMCGPKIDSPESAETDNRQARRTCQQCGPKIDSPESAETTARAGINNWQKAGGPKIDSPESAETRTGGHTVGLYLLWPQNRLTREC